MFYRLWMHQKAGINWKRIVVGRTLDTVMIVMFVLALRKVANGTSLTSLDLLRVTGVVVLAATWWLTYLGIKAKHMRLGHWIEFAAVTLVVAATLYLTRAVPRVADELRLAVYLNVGFGVFLWDMVAGYVPLTAAQLAKRAAKKEARSTADASEGPRTGSTSSGAVEPVVYVGEFVNDQGGETAYSPDAPRGSDEVPVSTWLRPSSS